MLKKSFKILLVSVVVLTSLMIQCEAKTKEISHVAGVDRIETSFLLSNYVKSKILVMANAYNFADALSSYNLVSSKKAKLILVSDNTNITDLLKNEDIQKVYLIGGERTLKGRPVEDAKKIVDNIVRISGSDRYDTNVQTLIESGYYEVGVADGRNYPDALSASGLLKKYNLGLMLVNGAKPYTTSRHVKYTFGGEKSIIQDGGIRLGGANRYTTSRLINNELKVAKNTVFVSGKNFADALSSLNLINLEKGVSIALSEGKLENNELLPLVNYFNKDKVVGKIFVIGGNFKSEFLKDILEPRINVLFSEINSEEKKKELNEKIEKLRKQIKEKSELYYHSDKLKTEGEREEVYKQKLELEVELTKLYREKYSKEIENNIKLDFDSMSGVSIDLESAINRLKEQNERLRKVKEKEFRTKKDGIYHYFYKKIGEKETNYEYKYYDYLGNNIYDHIIYEIKKEYPGYKLLESREDFNDLKKTNDISRPIKNIDINYIYITKNVIGEYRFLSEKNLDKYLYKKLSDGFLDNEEPVYLEGSSYDTKFCSYGFNEIIKGMGFNYNAKVLNNNSGLNLVRPYLKVNETICLKEEYIKEMEEVEKLIDASKIRRYNDKSMQAIEFAKFLVTFKNKHQGNIYSVDTPLALYGNKDKFGDKEIRWIFNQAMFKLSIPSYSVFSMDYKNNYIRTKINDKYRVIDLSIKKDSYNPEDIKSEDIFVSEDSNSVPNYLPEDDKYVDLFYNNIK